MAKTNTLCTNCKTSRAYIPHPIYIPIIGLNENKAQQAIHQLRRRCGLSDKVIESILPKISGFITRLSIATVNWEDHRQYIGCELRCKDLRRTYGREHWHHIIETLIEIRVMWVDPSYSNGYNGTDKFAKKYKLCGRPDEVDVNLAPVPREALLKHLMRLKRKRKNASHTLDPRKVLTTIFRKRLPTTDYTQGQLLSAVRDIHKVKKFFVSKYYPNPKKLTKRGICSTGRQFTTINGLPRYIRPMVTYKGQATIQIDFSACAPSILFILFDDEEEKAIWRKLIANDIYNSLGLSMSRKAVKKAFVTFIGGKGINQKDGRKKNSHLEREQLRELNEKLRELVPIAHSKMESIRARDKKELIRFTQRIESEIILPICKQFESAESIHDCILCSVEDADAVKQLMKDRFEEKVGLKPNTTREC